MNVSEGTFSTWILFLVDTFDRSEPRNIHWKLELLASIAVGSIQIGSETKEYDAH